LGGGLADAEFGEGGSDVVLDCASVGVEGGGGSFPIRDPLLELLLPEVYEVGDLVHRGEGAGLVGLGPVLELLEQVALGSCLGAADGGNRANVTVVVADPSLG
jgi:hypothetical protein